MSNYPQWKPGADPVHHLLFDIGYSYALLHSTEELLKRIVEHGEGSMEIPKVTELLQALQEFKSGRLQYRHEIYDNAEAAVAQLRT